MRRLALALAVLIGLGAPAWGQDFAKGLLAYGQRDYATAAKWFRLAGEQGDPAAQHGLGHMYEKGLGVPHDHAEAVKWYRKAAVQGFAWAQYSLGAAYTAGEGVRQDMAEGAKWYRKAAAQGLEVPAWTTLPSVFTQAPAAATGKVAKEAAEKKAARSGPAKTKKAPADAAKKKPPSEVQTERKTAVKKTPRTTSVPPAPDTSTAPAIKAPAASETAGTGAVGTTPGAKKAPLSSALKDAKQKTPGRRIVVADVKPAGKGPATGGATPASAPPKNYALAAPAAPPRLYDPPATARVVALSPPPVKAPPSPTIRSRPKAASAWRIQIAAVASAKAAKKEWQRIASANDDLLSKLKLDIRRADLGARGVFYRVQAGPLTSKSEARDLCTALKERKERCFIVPAK